MADPLVARLELFEPLSSGDTDALAALTERVILCGKRKDILREGAPVGSLYLMQGLGLPLHNSP